MPDSSLRTEQLQNWVERYQAGDAAAANELFKVALARMERLTHQMLSAFPRVRAWTETCDVVQASVLRLLNALNKIKPSSTRHFFNLVALQVRRELLELARSFIKHKEAILSEATHQDSSANGMLNQAPDRAGDSPDELEIWYRFHSSIEMLPEAECEVMSLCFYDGRTQLQVAELLEVSERTVRTRWQSACLKLSRLMNGQLPSL